MTKFEVLKEDIENINWNISIPDGLDDFDFEIKIQGNVGTGNKFSLMLFDNNSNGWFTRYQPNGTALYTENNLLIRECPNMASYIIRGKASKCAGSTRVLYTMRVYYTYGDFNDFIDIVGSTFNNGMQTLVLRVQNTGTGTAGIIKAGSSYKITPNITENSKTVGLVGDSMTDQYQREYDYFNEDNSINLGFPGQGLNSIKNNLTSYEFDYYEKAEKFILMAGTNDIPNIKNNSLSYEEFRELYINLIESMLLFSSDITLIEIMHVAKSGANGEGDKRDNETIENCNVIIRSLGQEYNIPVINMNKNFTGTAGYMLEEYSIDGLHFNEAGITQFNRMLALERSKV